MTDLGFIGGEGVVHEQGDGAPFVIRLSKTAGGSLTYTLGASLDRDEVPEAVVDALFALRELVEQRMAEPAGRKDKGRQPSLMAEMRRGLIVESMHKYGAEGNGWASTTEIVRWVKGHRTQVTADLKVLVDMGIVEYKRGAGGLYPSRYRLVTK